MFDAGALVFGSRYDKCYDRGVKKKSTYRSMVKEYLTLPRRAVEGLTEEVTF